MTHFAQTQLLLRTNQKVFYKFLQAVFLFGIALNFYHYSYSYALIIVCSLLSISTVTKQEHINTHFPKQTRLLLISIVLTLIIMKVSYFYNHDVPPHYLINFNDYLQINALLSVLAFLLLIFNTLLSVSLKQITYILLITSLPLLFSTVFMHNLDPLSVANPQPQCLVFCNTYVVSYSKTLLSKQS